MLLPKIPLPARKPRLGISTLLCCNGYSLLSAGNAAPDALHFNRGLVAEMMAQGLSEEDAVAALESCSGDGEQVIKALGCPTPYPTSPYAEP